MQIDNDVDHDELDERPQFPGIVMTAGVIWIGVGVLGIVNVVLSLAMAGANAAAGGGGGGANVGSPCCGMFIAIAFLMVGYQTVTGKAKDTLGNSIGSMVLGFIQIFAAIGIALLGAGVFGNQNINGMPPEVLLVTGIMVGVIGLTLVTAGILSLMGRRAYREWRQVAHPKKRSRRTERRREDDEREDDS